jgi:hypothetical protein
VKATTTCNGTPGRHFRRHGRQSAGVSHHRIAVRHHGRVDICVRRGRGSDANLRVAFSYGAQSANARRTLTKSGAAIQRYTFADQATTVNDSGSAALNTGPHIFVMHTAPGGTMIEGWIEGKPSSSGPTAAASNTSTTRTSIGADLAATATSFWQGVICDMAVRSGALTTMQRQRIEAYFAGSGARRTSCRLPISIGGGSRENYGQHVPARATARRE